MENQLCMNCGRPTFPNPTYCSQCGFLTSTNHEPTFVLSPVAFTKEPHILTNRPAATLPPTQPMHPPSTKDPTHIPTPATSASAPRRSHKMLRITINLLIVIGLVIGSLIGYLWYGYSRISPTSRLQTYCRDLHYGDWSAAWTHDIARQNPSAQVISQDQLMHNVDKDASRHKGIRQDCEISNVQENANTATATITFRYGDNSWSTAHEYTLFYEEPGNPLIFTPLYKNTWRIKADDWTDQY